MFFILFYTGSYVRMPNLFLQPLLAEDGEESRHGETESRNDDFKLWRGSAK